MILVLSTSSPVASAALFSPAREELGAAQQRAEHRAGETVLVLAEQLLARHGASWVDLEAVIADVGPGGFTGTRVGVTLAKTTAWALDLRVGAIGAHDLVARDGLVALPVRRGRWRVRDAAGHLSDADAWPEGALGYGAPEGEAEHWPCAGAVGWVWDRVQWTSPEALVPAYGADPSISTPKRPYTGERR